MSGESLGSWTPERVERMVDLWRQGWSASQIAADLGLAGRSAVCGKLARMGLGRSERVGDRKVRAAPRLTRPAIKGPAIKAPSAPRPVALKLAGNSMVFHDEPNPRPPRAMPATQDATPGSATAMTLKSHHCRWPIGDPQKPGFTFCGVRKARGWYCAKHAEIAHLPAPPRKVRAA